MRSPSTTGAYRDYAHSLERDLEKMARHFPPIEDQVGFVAVCGDRVEGAEIVGDPAVYAGVHDRLLRAYTIDAIDGTQAECEPGQGVEILAPEDFLRMIANSAYETSPSLGQGTDLRLSGDAVGGCALECSGIVHLMAFPNSTRADRSGSGGSRREGATCGSSGRIRSRSVLRRR